MYSAQVPPLWGFSGHCQPQRLWQLVIGPLLEAAVENVAEAAVVVGRHVAEAAAVAWLLL